MCLSLHHCWFLLWHSLRRCEFCCNWITLVWLTLSCDTDKDGVCCLHMQDVPTSHSSWVWRGNAGGWTNSDLRIQWTQPVSVVQLNRLTSILRSEPWLLAGWHHWSHELHWKVWLFLKVVNFDFDETSSVDRTLFTVDTRCYISMQFSVDNVKTCGLKGWPQWWHSCGVNSIEHRYSLTQSQDSDISISIFLLTDLNSDCLPSACSVVRILRADWWSHKIWGSRGLIIHLMHCRVATMWTAVECCSCVNSILVVCQWLMKLTVCHCGWSWS